MNLFGKKKNIKVSPTESINSIKSTIDTLEKKETFLEKSILICRNSARTVLKINKKKAIMFLRKAKLLEKQADTIFNMKINLETQLLAIDQAFSNIEVFNTVKQGKEYLSEIEKKVDPNKVAEVVDSIQENIDNVNEVSEMLGTPINTDMTDEENLLAEFEAEIETEKLDAYVKPVETPILSMPNAPKNVPTANASKSKEDKELEELQKMMT